MENRLRTVPTEYQHMQKIFKSIGVYHDETTVFIITRRSVIISDETIGVYHDDIMESCF